MDDAVEVVDDEQEQELKLPMQPMVLERKGNLKRDQDRREEEQGTGKEEENNGWMMTLHQRMTQWKKCS